MPSAAGQNIGESASSVRSRPWVRFRRQPPRHQHLEELSMKKKLALRYAALIACAGLGLATPALAQDKTAKIAVLNDMSSLYADLSLIHISEPTRLGMISYAVFC